MASELVFFDLALHKMICSKGDFSSLYEISHVNGQIIATFKKVNHYKRGTEIFIKHLPSDVLLQDILEIVFPMGPIYQIRILLEFSGHCRGYSYINFFEVESARKSMIVLCGKQIRDIPIVVKMSFDNNRLEILNVPKEHSAENVFKEVSKIIGNGLQEVFFVNSKDLRKDGVNCILVYNTHKNALEARKQVFNGFSMFGKNFRIDWAIPIEKIKSKRLYFDTPLPKLSKPELYEEIIKTVKQNHILNIFLQNGTGYITFENETVAYEAFKMLKNVKMFGVNFKLSFKKFYTSLPNNSCNSSTSENSDMFENQMTQEYSTDSSSSIQQQNNRYESPRSSFSSNESSLMPMANSYVDQLPVFVNAVPNISMVPVQQEMARQLTNTQILNYGMSINANELYHISGVPYAANGCSISQYQRQQYVQPPIRIVQLNSNNNMPVHFIQMTQEFYKHFHPR